MTPVHLLAKELGIELKDLISHLGLEKRDRLVFLP